MPPYKSVRCLICKGVGWVIDPNSRGLVKKFIKCSSCRGKGFKYKKQ